MSIAALPERSGGSFSDTWQTRKKASALKSAEAFRDRITSRLDGRGGLGGDTGIMSGTKESSRPYKFFCTSGGGAGLSLALAKGTGISDAIIACAGTCERLSRYMRA